MELAASLRQGSKAESYAMDCASVDEAVDKALEASIDEFATKINATLASLLGSLRCVVLLCFFFCP